MGALFGRTRAVETPTPAAEERGMVWPFPSTLGGGRYAVDASGDLALQSIAVQSSMDLICSLMSELPLKAYLTVGETRSQVATPPQVLDPARDGYGLQDWVYQLGMSWLSRGNAYADIAETGPKNAPRRLVLFNPDDVYPQMDAGRPVWMVNGQQKPQGTLLHARVNPVPGRLLGLSPIALHAAQIGTSISASRYGQDFFADGAHPSALLTNDEGLSPEQIQTAKSRWMATMQGNREPAVMGKGWDYKPIQVTPEESQFLATQGFTEAQCARIFGAGVLETLGYESGGSMTYSNVVDRRSDLLQFTVNRWLLRAERVLEMLVPEGMELEFDRDALLQTGTLARYQAHAIALTHRFRTVNEVRTDENEPPVEWGDEPNSPAPAGGK